MSFSKKLNPGAQHIANNFVLFGFGSESSSFVQCVKELVENSIDACKQADCNTYNPNIIISVTSVEDDDTVLLVTVSDEGSGMKDPQKLLQCFSTSKVSNEDTVHTTGRFGVGLSTCLIYSLVHCNYPLRIISKTSTDTFCTVADFTLDSNGNPNMIQSEQHTVDLISGTKISIYMPNSSEAEIPQAILCLDTFLKNFVLLPTTFINIKFSVHIDNKELSQSYHRDAEYKGWNSQSAKIIIQLPTFEEYKNNLMVQFTGIANAENTNINECSTARIMDNNNSMVIVSVIVTKSANDETSEDGINDIMNGMPVKVIRYANGVPLLDFQDDATSCAISAGLRAVKWGAFGRKLSLNLLRANEVSTKDTCQSPRWILHNLLEVYCGSYFTMTIICDIQAQNIPFANMRKTCISCDDKTICRGVTAGLKDCLYQLQNKEMTKYLFLSKRDTEQLRIGTTYIPSVISSIVGILAHSKDPTIMQNILEKVGQTDDSGTVQESLHKTLETRLRKLFMGLYSDRNNAGK